MEALGQWKDQYAKGIDTTKKQNEEEIELQKNAHEESKKGNNPWNRVIDNCEVNPDKYIGDKDVSRMRQVMIARKADITKQGGMQ